MWGHGTDYKFGFDQLNFVGNSHLRFDLGQCNGNGKILHLIETDVGSRSLRSLLLLPPYASPRHKPLLPLTDNYENGYAQHVFHANNWFQHVWAGDREFMTFDPVFGDYNGPATVAEDGYVDTHLPRPQLRCRALIGLIVSQCRRDADNISFGQGLAVCGQRARRHGVGAGRDGRGAIPARSQRVSLRVDSGQSF